VSSLSSTPSRTTEPEVGRSSAGALAPVPLANRVELYDRTRSLALHLSARCFRTGASAGARGGSNYRDTRQATGQTPNRVSEPHGLKRPRLC
jgi:hypothetical protein